MTDWARFTVYWWKESYSQWPGILVWNFTFHARNSKTEGLLSMQDHQHDLTITLTSFDTFKKGILVCNFTFHLKKNSKSESLFSRTPTRCDRYTVTLIICHTKFNTLGKWEGVFAMYFSLAGWQIEPDFIARWRNENQSLRASDLVRNEILLLTPISF